MKLGSGMPSGDKFNASKKSKARQQRGKAQIARAVRTSVEELEKRQMLSTGPTAVLHGPYNVNEGSDITISGVDSTDSSGTIVSYKWDFNYNPANGFHTQGTGNPVVFEGSDGPESQTIALRVTDSNGLTDTTTATLNTLNVAPTITLTGNDSVAEAGTYNLNWSATDPGDDTISNWEINWGDGTAHTNVAGNVSGASHVFNDHGTPTITVTATDEDGSYSQTKGITVTPTLPVVQLSGNPNVDEGTSYRINFSSTDAGGDARSGWVIDWGDGTVIATGASATTRVHTYTSSGAYSITVTALSADGDEGSATLGVNVNNIPPSVGITGGPSGSSPEGTPLTFGSNVSDPGTSETLTYTWMVLKDNGLYSLPDGTDTASPTFTFTPRHSGDYVVRLDVSDGTDTTTQTTDISVMNVAPGGTISGAPTDAVDEGSQIALVANPSDAGADDTFTYSWSVTKDTVAYTLPDGTDTSSDLFAFTPRDNGTYIATVVISDDDGATHSVSTDGMIVNNVAPTGNITGEPVDPITEGDSVTLGAHASDVGTDDTFTYAWSVTRNTVEYTLPDDVDTTSAAFTFVPRDNGTYVATCQISDDDGGSVTKHSADITVLNASPTGTITGQPDGDILEGDTVDLTAKASDVGVDDQLSYSWSVTKGGEDFALPDGTDTGSADFSFSPDDQGIYVAKCTVSDQDGGSVDLVTDAIIANNATPVAEISEQPSGPVDEGSTIELTVAAGDAGAHDNIQFAWTVTKDDVEFTLPDGTDTTSPTFSFIAPDNGTYVGKCTVTDKYGASTSASTDPIIVNDVAPTGEISGEPSDAIDEGTPVSLSVDASDAGATDTISYSWSVKNGENDFILPDGTDTSSETFNFTPNDNGSYVATVRLTDNDGSHRDVSTDPITVNNVNPTATITGTPTDPIEEGTNVSLTANPADAGSADTFTYSWSVKNGSETFNLPEGTDTSSAAFNFVPVGSGTYVATCVVSDDDGGSVTVQTDDITVNNAPPSGSIGFGGGANGGLAQDQVFSEGSPITVTASADDLGGGSLTYAWTVQKDHADYTLDEGTVTDQPSFTFTPDDNGSYVLSCVVTDDQDATSTFTTDPINVINVDPTATVSGAPTDPINEGDTVMLTANPSDAGSADTFTYSWSVSTDAGAYDLTGVTTDQKDFTFAPNDNGNYIATVRVTDDDGGFVDASTATIVVNNVDPSVTITGAPSGHVNEGSTLSLTANPTDPGSADTFTYAWTVTKDEHEFTLPDGTDANSQTLTFVAPDDGVYVATVTVTDKDNGSGDASTDDINVDNVAPTGTITGEPVDSISEGTPVTLGAHASDAGVNDTFTYAWSVKKDNAEYTLPEDVDTTSADFTFTPGHSGTFVASCIITDNGGASVTKHSADIVVTNVAPSVSIDTVDGGSGEQGSTVHMQANVVDPGTDDTISYSWSVKLNDEDVTLPDGTDTSSQDFSFTPMDQGDYVVSVSVSDGDGGSDSASTDPITIVNAPPTGSVDGAPTDPIDEGTPVTVTADASDVGGGELTYSWSVTRNDGETFNLPEDAVTDQAGFTFTPTDNGTYIATVNVTDGDGATTPISTDPITVNNVNPMATISNQPGAPIDEGTPVTLTANPSDAGSEDTFTYAWTVTTGESEPYSLPDGTDTSSAGFTFTPRDNGTYVATVVVTDKDGGFVSVDSDPITVNNVAPTVAISGAPVGVGEVSSSLPGNGSDSVRDDGMAIGDPHSTIVGDRLGHMFVGVMKWSIPEGLTADDVNSASLVLHRFFGPERQVDLVTYDSASGSVSGADYAAATAATTVVASNVFTESGEITISNEALVQAIKDAITAGRDHVTFALRLTDNTEQGSDDYGQMGGPQYLSEDQHPSLTINPPAPLVEGSTTTLTAGVTDPGSEDTFTYAWSVTEDTQPYDTGELATDQPTFDFTPNDNGDYVVTATVTDKDGGIGTSTQEFTVTNAAPTGTITGLPEGQTFEGSPINLHVDASDAGAADVSSLTYSWSVTVGEGSPVDLPDGTDTSSADFTFTPVDDGTYTATVHIADKDGGSVDVSTDPITVSNAAPTVTISGQPTGIQTLNATLADDAADSVSNLGYQFHGPEEVFITDSDVNSQLTLGVMKWQLPEGLTVDNVNNAAFTLYTGQSVARQVNLYTYDSDSSTVSTDDYAPAAAASTLVQADIMSTSGQTNEISNQALIDAIKSAITNGRSYVTFSIRFADNTSQESFDQGWVGGPENDHPPTLTIYSGVPDVVEGSTRTLTADASDVGANDTLTYSWSVTKNQEPYDTGELPTDQPTFDFMPDDNGDYVVTSTVTDNGGAVGSDSVEINVLNANPTGTIDGIPQDGVDEGTPVELSVTPSDAGPLDTDFTYSWSTFLNGAPYSLPDGVDTSSSAFTFTPQTSGSYVTKVTITDKDGGQTTLESDPFNVNNVAPTVTITGATAGTSNVSATVPTNADGYVIDWVSVRLP